MNTARKEAEQQVLGAILANPDEFLPKFIADDGGSHLFADQFHRALYRGVFGRWCNGVPLSPTELKQIGGSAPFNEQVPITLIVGEINEAFVTGAHFGLYNRRLWEFWGQQELEQSLANAMASNGDQTLDEKIAELEASFHRIKSNGGGRDKEQFTFAELAELYPTLEPPVVDGVLRQGEVGNIISDSKIGKSWLAKMLALSIIVGRDWFGFETTQGKVLYIDNELKRSTLVYRFRQVADAMGIPHQHYDNDLEIRSLRGKLRSLPDLAVDLHRIKPGKFKLIVFDAKYRFAANGTSENSNTDEAQLYNLVDSIAERTGAAVVLIHHASKGDQSGKKITDVGAGAGSQSRAADAHLILRPHEIEGAFVLDAAVRSFPPIEPIVLRWSFPIWTADHEADPARLKMATTTNERQQAKRDHDGKLAIVSALLAGPATARVLRTRTSMGPDRLTRLIGILEAEGQIVGSEVEILGNKTMEYRNAESTP